MVDDGERDRIVIRPILQSDYAEWRALWDGYNAFYGRHGPTALPEAITAATWERFFDTDELVHAFVAVEQGRMVGLAHFVFHRSTTRLTDVCYLQDLFTVPARRGSGIGRQLMAAVYEAARTAGSTRVYWQTQDSNLPARRLYDALGSHHGFIVYTHEL